jgi:hypothetical protein
MGHVTCFAWGQANQWEALCVDYDIAATGRTFDDVRQRLHEAIADYLALVEQEAPEDRHRLLNRKSPWHLRAQLWAAYGLHRIVQRLGKRDGGTIEFTLPCHA